MSIIIYAVCKNKKQPGTAIFVAQIHRKTADLAILDM